MRFALDQLEKQLMGREARGPTASKRAAVAALLRYTEPTEPSVLLMRRAVRAGDPWSGHICFPGGKEEAQDATPLATAMRETREELGLDLAQCSRLLGPLDAVQAMSKGRLLPTVILPFVFVQTRDARVTLGDEAAHAFWLPLRAAASGSLDARYLYDPKGANVELPCWRFEGEVIWGLTFKMLQSLLGLVEGRTRG